MDVKVNHEEVRDEGRVSADCTVECYCNARRLELSRDDVNVNVNQWSVEVLVSTASISQ